MRSQVESLRLKPPTQRGVMSFLRTLDKSWLLLLPILLLIGALYILPLFNVLVMSVSDPKPGLGNYERLFTSRGPLRIVITTLRVCSITTLVTVFFAYFVAYVMANSREMHRRVLLVCVLLPLWVSVLIRAMSWLVLLRDNGPINSWLMEHGWIQSPIPLVRNELGVIIGMIHYLLPFAIFPLFATMRDIDQRLLFASKSLGASAKQTFLKVYFPLTAPGVFAASVVVFVFGLGFYVTPAILGGGRVVMLAESISVEVMQTLRWGFAAAQAIFLLVTTLVLMRIMAKTVGFKRGFG